MTLSLQAFTPEGLFVLNKYRAEWESTPQEVLSRVASALSEGDQGLEERLTNAASRRWFTFSSPMLKNAGRKGGLPISCFVLDDPSEPGTGFIRHLDESCALLSLGGGVGARVQGAEENLKQDVIPLLKVVESSLAICGQSNFRSPGYAAYMDVDHADIREFIEMRFKRGDQRSKPLDLHHGVNLTDEFMEAVRDGRTWVLRNGDTIPARELFQDILQMRLFTGEPYFHFVDTSNRALHPAHKKQGLRIKSGNLCNEILLPTSSELTPLCCIASLNLELYDEWKETNLVQDLVRMLDNTISVFLRDLPQGPQYERVRVAAERFRPLGLSTCGFFTYLQDQLINPASEEALEATSRIYETIQTRACEETQRLALERGEPADLVGYGVRNAYLTTAAPPATTALILGVSPDRAYF